LASTPKPEFGKFIAGITSVGSWSPSCRPILVACIEGDNFDDATIRQVLASMSLKEGVDAEIVYMTLLSWYILDDIFSDE